MRAEDNINQGGLSQEIKKNSDNKLTQKQKQDEIRKKQQQYYAEKKARKIQIMKQKKQMFGQSSSDDEDLSPKKAMPKTQSNNKIPKQQPIKVKKTLDKYTVTIKNSKVKAQIQFLQNTFVITNLDQNIQNLSSIKAFIQVKPNDQQHLIQLIYKTNNTEILLGVSDQMANQNVPLHYYIFAKIISLKLNSMKVKYIQKPPPKPQTIQKLIVNSDIYGNLFKKSQFLGNWQERLLVLNLQGLFSYKDPNQKPSMQIIWKTVKQFSTSFEILQDTNLVVKITYGTQTSFGIPIIHYEDTTLKNNWLYHMYRRSTKALK